MTFFLILSNPLTSIPQIISVLDTFSSFSGYKLNFCKSKLFPLNSSSLQISYSDFQLKVVRNRLKYLGIQVTHKYSDLFSDNISPLHKHVKSLFVSPYLWYERWMLSTWMFFLNFLFFFSAFLYLFQDLFLQFCSKIFLLSYGISRKRINQSYLMKPKCLGGLALSNFQTLGSEC